MSDVISNDELNALAAEYVLGTLDHEERKGASALLEVDPTFRGIVRIWEKRFGELHLMVEAVQPDPQLWDRIRPKLAGVEQVAPAISSQPAEPASPERAAEEGAAVADETMPSDPAAAATAEAELQLAELAALLPVPAELRDAPVPPPEDTQARAAEQIQRGFVPPPPMVRRSPPPVAPTVVRKGGRGWMAIGLAMALLAILLVGLIGAWRYFPERLPAQLRADTVLNLPVVEPPPPPPPSPPKPRPPAPFDE